MYACMCVCIQVYIYMYTHYFYHFSKHNQFCILPPTPRRELVLAERAGATFSIIFSQSLNCTLFLVFEGGSTVQSYDMAFSTQFSLQMDNGSMIDSMSSAFPRELEQYQDVCYYHDYYCCDYYH